MDIITYALLKKKLEKKANLDSPHFTGEPTAPTPASTDDSDRIATTAFVQDLIEGGGSTDTKYTISRDGEYIVLAGTDGLISTAHLPVEYGTTSEWSGRAGETSQEGVFYVYTDARLDEQGNAVPAFKLGDGLAYIGDLPFVDVEFVSHINNPDIHVTQQEKTKWNDKVRCYILENSENLIFTTN